jgi:hypothetical protein
MLLFCSVSHFKLITATTIKHKQKLLFCETDEGKAHMARQLSASCYVDNQSAILEMLLPFVRLLVLVQPSSSQQDRNMTSIPPRLLEQQSERFIRVDSLEEAL